MAAGDLDGSFGDGGKVILPGVGVADAGNKVLLQPDGKVLLPATQSGGTGVSVTRLTSGAATYGS